MDIENHHLKNTTLIIISVAWMNECMHESSVGDKIGR